MMKGQKGITLIALIITIIVMLILVGTSITIALNGGLIGQAKKAKTDYEGADDNLQNVDKEVSFNDGTHNYTGIDNIVNGTNSDTP